ncbi:FAD-dependent oxidoreductase [Bradyrhizobium sp. USDA 4452]
MISKADAIIVGSGALGAATAYYLSKRKGLSVALIDKHEIGSQTSPRAAGMVSCVRKGDLMIGLIKDACRKIETFTEETGQPLDWVHSRSLRIARRPQDAQVIKGDLERGRRMGLDVELVSPEEANRLNPFLKPTGVEAAMRIGDDRYFDPAQVAIGFAKAVCDYVHNRLEFGYHHARCDRTAAEGHDEQRGVCRDFTHLAITLCRCLNIPARYCTGYLGDIGVPKDPAPMDFSACFEAYLGGRWYTFDARHNHPRIGRIVIARGRDAADVAISTAFGPAQLSSFAIITEERSTPKEQQTCNHAPPEREAAFA